MRTENAKRDQNEHDLRHLYMLAQSSFAKFEDLRTRVSKEVTKLEACYKALEDLCNLSSKASMEAKSALRAKVWRAEKEVLPEDTDQPADAQDPTLYLSSQAKPSTASGSTPPPWASGSSPT